VSHDTPNDGDEMVAEPAIDAIFIDWAGTITRPMIEIFRGAIEGAELGEEATNAVIAGLAEYLTGDDSPLHRAERGEIDDDEMFDWLDEHLPEGHPPVAEAVFAGPEPWSFLNAPDRPEVGELLDDLVDSDVFVAVTTNNFVVGQERLASRYLATLRAGAIVNSALIGIRKPDPAYFELVLETFDLDPARVLVLDDNQANLDVAAELGMLTELVGDDAAPAVARTRSLAGLPA